MSKHAPYICLAIDWRESDQFDDTPHGHRLAWIELLCYAKTDGRGQIERKVHWNPKRFAKRFRVDLSAVKGMTERAASDGAIRVEDDTLTILNWGAYQERSRKAQSRAGPCQDSQDKQDGAPPSTSEERGATSMGHGPRAMNQETHTQTPECAREVSPSAALIDEIVKAYPPAGLPGGRQSGVHRRNVADAILRDSLDADHLLARVRRYAESPLVARGIVMGLRKFLDTAEYDSDDSRWDYETKPKRRKPSEVRDADHGG